MDYTHLSDDHKLRITEERLLAFEADHYQHTLLLQAAPPHEGDEPEPEREKIENYLAELEAQIKTHRAELETLKPKPKPKKRSK